MPSRNKPEPSWQVILEEIRSQNRSTIEAVEAARVALEQRIERLDQDTRSRDGVLELAIRLNGAEMRELKATVQQNGLDIGELKASVRQNGLGIGELKAGVQQHGLDIGELKASVRDLKSGVHENSVDLRSLATRVEALARIEERVAALERRTAS